MLTGILTSLERASHVLEASSGGPYGAHNASAWMLLRHDARDVRTFHGHGSDGALPLGAAMYEDVKEYLNWYDTRKDMVFAKNAPIIGLVLQRSHLVTGDEGHYSGVVSEMEARGAKVGFLLKSPASTSQKNLSTAGMQRCPRTSQQAPLVPMLSSGEGSVVWVLEICCIPGG